MIELYFLNNYSLVVVLVSLSMEVEQSYHFDVTLPEGENQFSFQPITITISKDGEVVLFSEDYGVEAMPLKKILTFIKKVGDIWEGIADEWELALANSCKIIEGETTLSDIEGETTLAYSLYAMPTTKSRAKIYKRFGFYEPIPGEWDWLIYSNS